MAIDLKRLFVPVFFINKSPETARKKERRNEIFKMTETEKMFDNDACLLDSLAIPDLYNVLIR